jgi:hypothetical protein
MHTHAARLFAVLFAFSLAQPLPAQTTSAHVPRYSFVQIVQRDNEYIAIFETTDPKGSTVIFHVGDTFFDGSKIVEINEEAIKVTDQQGIHIIRIIRANPMRRGPFVPDVSPRPRDVT